jgi:hypothetical protein
MKYAQHRSNIPLKRSKSGGSLVKFIIGIIVLIVIIFVGKLIFSKKIVEEVDVAEEIDVVEEVQVELSDPVDQSTSFEEIDLLYSDTGGYAGFARRGGDESLFTHVIVGNFVSINTETHFYEGWLVKPGVTEFFSTGEMFAREDGKWGLVWESELDSARDDVLDFSKVVITLEPRDGDDGPSPAHVAEAEFKE